MAIDPLLSISANLSLLGARLAALEAGGGSVDPQARAIPSAAWDGTGGSGFAGNVPTQTGTALTTRLEYGYMLGTVAPVAHWVAPLYTDDLFTDDKTVAVTTFAAADEGIAGGVAKVIFHVEGTDIEVTAMTAVDVPVNTAAGTAMGKVPAYAITLPWADIPDLGQSAIDIYAEIVPTDPTIATRTIGPMRLYRKTGYDRVIDIAPSQVAASPTRFQTAQAAMTYAAANWSTGEHWLLRYLENGVIDPSAISFNNPATNTNGKRGHVRVAANGFNVIARRPLLSQSLFRPSFNGIIFDGIKIDTANISQFFSEVGQTAFRPTVLRNCEIYSSNGKVEYLGDPTVTPPVTRTVRNGGAKQCFNGPTLFENCYLHDMLCGDIAVPVMVGCRVRDMTNDSLLISGSQPYLKLLCDEERVSGEPVRSPIPSLQLTYNGGGGAATWDTLNQEGAADRALILKVAGVEVMRYTIPIVSTSANYTFEQLAASINADLGASGWGATSLDTQGPGGVSRLRANHLGSALTEIPANPTINPNFGSVVGSRPVSEVIVACTDAHTDTSQLGGGAYNHENVLVMNNSHRDCVAQFALISVQTADRMAHNIAYLQNSGENISSYPQRDFLFAQFSGAQKHTMIVHNTYPDQGMVIRTVQTAVATVFDPYCRMYANVFASLGKDTTDAPGSAITGKIKDNAILGTNSLVIGSNVVNNPSNLGIVANFPAINATPFAAASFVPAAGSPLRATLVAAQVPFDAAGRTRQSSDIAGSVAMFA